ncbi:dihydroneopterin aldolase [Okibacterium fritillariae]|uniref:7,8-dihydroneopterin aldolase n=1 Tax=Okibacterium fritillariae TaxID=123320 RepID=A0A1T5KTA0_9MICO|nr:dihydroneopterin aldolase [Okibacterium fritillariae]SKC67002.1 dihydroneopterin aldolase [Okibacterium fritillariae]
MASLDTIQLTGLRVRAHHGVYDFERENGQDFVIDVTVWLDLARAAASDDVSTTIHYGELAESIARAVAGDPVDLIETVAERVATLVLSYPAAERTRVTVHKPDAPISVPFADVAVSIEREQKVPSASGDHATRDDQATRDDHATGARPGRHGSADRADADA